MEYQQWLKQAIDRLTASESPRRDAEILLAFVTGRTRTFILAFGETALTDDEHARLDALLARRAAGEPVAYLIGQREFWSLPLEVSPATLIPRPDTECLVEQALARLPATPCRILDLGTGTGAIALRSPLSVLTATSPRWISSRRRWRLRNATHSGSASIMSRFCKATGFPH